MRFLIGLVFVLPLFSQPGQDSTVRSKPYLMNTFRDNQPDNSIRAVNMRDFVASAMPTAPLPFTAQAPGMALAAGAAATVTLTPCPLGVAGSNQNYYLYLSGGSGVAEAVLVTGGTCTSGGAIGTIQFTPANSHSDAWTMQSATAGISEAIAANPGPVAIQLTGNVNLYAGLRIVNQGNTFVDISGTGTASTTIHCVGNFPVPGGSNSCISFVQGGVQNSDVHKSGVHDFTLFLDNAGKDGLKFEGIQNNPELVTNVRTFGGRDSLTLTNGASSNTIDNFFADDVARNCLTMDVSQAGGHRLSNITCRNNLASNSGTAIEITSSNSNQAWEGFTGNLIQVYGRFQKGFYVHNTSGTRTAMFVMCTTCIADSTLFTDSAWVIENVKEVHLTNSWGIDSNSTGAAGGGGFKIDNSQQVKLRGGTVAYSSRTAGYGDVGIFNGSREIFVTGAVLNGTVRNWYVDSSNPPTAIVVGDNYESRPGGASATDIKSFGKSFTNQSFTSSMWGLFSDTTSFTSWQLSNIDPTPIETRYLRVNAQGNFELVNGTHSALDLSANKDGTLSLRSGGSDNKAVCWKAAAGGVRQLGYCSSTVDSSGNCTCN